MKKCFQNTFHKVYEKCMGMYEKCMDVIKRMDLRFVLKQQTLKPRKMSAAKNYQASW